MKNLLPLLLILSLATTAPGQNASTPEPPPSIEDHIATLQRQVAAAPNDRDLRKNLARLYFAQAQRADTEGRRKDGREGYAHSVNHFLAAFALSPGDPQEYTLVADVLTYVGRAPESVELLRTARTHHPEDYSVWIALAEALSSARQYDQAVAEFKAIEVNAKPARPDLLNDQFYYTYGAAAERAKHYDLAEVCLQESIAMAPVDAEPQRAARAFNYLGYLWLERGIKLDEAEKAILRANELLPDEGAFVDSLGWYYFQTKDFARALQHVTHAAELMDLSDPENAVVLDHLAQCHYALGHREDALREIRRAVALTPEDKAIQGRLRQYESAR